MKKFGIITVLSLLVFLPNLKAQPSDKYGGDKEACGRNYTIYYEMYKLKNFEEAIPYWQKTVSICPRFSASLWKNGEKMYVQKIKNTTDEKIREELIDSLLWIFDQRMLHFGEDLRTGTGYILGKKGVAMAKYRPKEYTQAYNTLKESIKIQQQNAKADVVLTFMKISRILYSDGIISSEDILRDYETSMKVVEANLGKDPQDKNFTLVKEGVDNHFSKSGAADCEALQAIYAKQFVLQKSDQDWVNRVLMQLKSTGCSDSEFYMEMLLAQYAISPSGTSAHHIAQRLMQDEKLEQAIYYLELSLEQPLDENEKANVLYEVAYIQYSQYKDYQKARDYARKALEIRPSWGDPSLLIGRIYIDARAEVFDDEFDQKSVLWAAIDQFAKAKRVDPEVKDKAEELIKAYSILLPTKESLFYYSLKNGDPYQVKGWINEKTKVKSRD